mmetsp:Transcript_1160/g.1208  ORF Transcript_1160/g.1208 Transcript_1160/m.1208 type:complete len:347 (+) Transcript_1160:373-1413(+)|eukprot:CAMPEP_0182427926 /NCGR_PEP_ID=MMETSP1167-20130531/20848_1 /TAXON_ID=2988 /ORGANISM="Mallomonas Sp, Strain CCMP3275" /LENGTH=346 /DNA_ID=CAMNT_0024610513 /DNA_START=127 /DNA_END=1167 /DNA_ORIENTATION=-
MSVQFKKRTSKISRSGLRIKKDDDNDDLNKDLPQIHETAAVVAEEGRGSNSSELGVQDSEREVPVLYESVTTLFRSTREATQSTAGDATRTLEIDTATDRDARAVLERNIRLNEERERESEREGEKGVYRGQAGYMNYRKKDMAQVGGNKHTGTHGPIRAPTFVRSSARFDYQPDICKDYKETGFCGYGDQCKFLHDRGDYKSGWQLEREWDAEQAKKKKKLEQSLKAFARDSEDVELIADKEEEEEDYAVSDEEDALPFACYICREPFTDPVMTLCKHYFCRACALSHEKQTKRCAACGLQTSGVFNKAEKLIKKMTAVGSSNVVVEQTNSVTASTARKGQWEIV